MMWLIYNPVSPVSSKSSLALWSLQVDSLVGKCSIIYIGHEIFSTATSERMCNEYWLTAKVKPAKEKCG